jgi:RimJ/RimL family protein N-acetyltransferase
MFETDYRRMSTERLDLVQLSADHVQALADGNPEPVERLLNARFQTPYAPPPLMDDALPFIAGWLHDHPDSTWWQPWFFADRALGLVIGSAGFSGPSESHALQLGYAVYPAFHGKGYAAEAATALVRAAWSDPCISAIQATIPPWNSQSIRVAEKIGMTAVGTGMDDEVGQIIIYEICRPART